MGDNKEHTLEMAAEAFNGHFDCLDEQSKYIPLPVDRSHEGLFPIEVEKNIAIRILLKKIKVVEEEINLLKNTSPAKPGLKLESMKEVHA